MSLVLSTRPSRPWRPGRDPRAVRHPAPARRDRAPEGAAPVVVVGGGVAGLAATTGFLAANRLLADVGVRGHDLWSVPVQARNRVSAPLHRLLLRVPWRRRTARTQKRDGSYEPSLRLLLR